MEKQRICIVGDGLSGLTAAIALDNLSNVDVHLISRKITKKQDRRTTAISESNFNFLIDNFNSLNKKMFWPSKHIQLFYETNKNKINFLNISEDKNNLMYVFENDKIKNILVKEIKKKKIKISYKDIKSINELKDYELIILCLGGNSKIYRSTVKGRSINKDYKEVAITGYVKHKIKDLNTSQFFLKEGPLAILPFSKNNFSFVWSVNKDFYNSHTKKIIKLIKNKILDLFNPSTKIQINNIQSYPITLKLKKNYHDKNILILGEGLHTVHPVAGQGFNLVVKDIKKLKEILNYYTSLGISIKSSYALKDFYDSRKPENFLMGLGIDVTHNFFKKNKYLDPFKKIIITNINKSNIIEKISKIISNQGLSL